MKFIVALWSFFWRLFKRKDKRQPVKSRPLQPLNAKGWTLLVDASNLAYKNGDVRLEHLLEALDLLHVRFHRATIHLICDANLSYKVGGEKQMRKALGNVSTKINMEISHGRQADSVLLEQARIQPRSIIVSNDWFGKGDELHARLHIPRLGVSLKGKNYILATQLIVFEDPQNL